MSAVLRKVLFWLVMLALPLHGITAAAAMPQSAGHGAVQMQDGSRHDEALAMGTTGITRHSTEICAGLLPGCAAHGHQGSMNCSLSAPCGLVAAAALQNPPLPGHTASAPVAVPSHERVAFFTDAPERPPRFQA